MVKWEDITGGYSGFEQLAARYVEEEFKFPYGNWKKTKETRDGNKDAYTIIVGYHPHVGQDETWWMEAKYSTSEKRTHLTRFRLDATIVSSIFHNKVSKIIFVTNIDVHSKTVSDIRLALQKAIGCEDVYFSTRQVLEYWLLQNPTIYSEYFSGPLPSVDMAETLFISEEISIYPYPSNNGYIEKCTHIYLNKTYEAHFKVISAKTYEAGIKPAQKGVVLEDKKLSLVRGETAVRVCFHLTEKFHNCHISEDGRESRQLDLFTLDRVCAVLLKTPIEILSQTDFCLAVESQIMALNQLSCDITVFRKERQMKIATLYGESGTGKSFIVNRYMAYPAMRNEQLYYYNFSEDHVENARRMLYFVFFLLLPYVNPDEIDSNYLNGIGDSTEITRDLIELSKYRDRPDLLERAFQSYCKNRGRVLPERCELNTRYVFLDNIQNLNATAWAFLLSVLQEVRRKKVPLFLLLIGQNYITESCFYRELKQTYDLKDYYCKLETDDIIKNIGDITSFDLSKCSEIIQNYFPNLIVLISFLKFAQISSASEFHELSDFLTLYIQFANGGLQKSLVLDQFKNAMSNAELRKLCFAIYTVPNGIAVDLSNRLATSALLQSGLVKFNERNMLVPFHDIYERIFRSAYQLSKQDMGLPYVDDLDEARDRILFPAVPSDIAQVAERITHLRKTGQFYSVCYILDSYFEGLHINAPIGLLSNPQYSDIFYQMYFDYAYAAVNCSHRHSGYDFFERIYSEIEHKTSPQMRQLKTELLFELMNGNYNILHFRQAMQRYRQFQETIQVLIRTGLLPHRRAENEMFVLCENMRILIQSARGKKRSEQMFLCWRSILKEMSYSHHYIDFNIRYAHTLYTVAPQRALAYTEEANNCLLDEGAGNSKLWCLAKFQHLYLQFLLRRDDSLIPKLEEVTEKAKRDYYSSYRHRNLALCAILYVKKDVQRADERFLSDMAHPRQLRDKLKGFYFETLALHYLAHGDTMNAGRALAQAAETFCNTRDYLRTVRHNQKVIKRGLYSQNRMDYNLGGLLKRDWYYIDPRSD